MKNVHLHIHTYSISIPLFLRYHRHTHTHILSTFLSFYVPPNKYTLFLCTLNEYIDNFHIYKTWQQPSVTVGCNIERNERADILAKKGSKIKQKKTTKFPYESIRRVIKKKINDNYVKYVKLNGNLKKLLENSNLIPELARKTVVTMF